MKKGLSAIITGLCLIFLSLYFLNYFQNPPSGLFSILIGSFGLILIITGLLQLRNSYNKKVYLSLTTMIIAGMLIISIIQISTPSFGDITTGIILIVMFTSIIVYLAYQIDKINI